MTPMTPAVRTVITPEQAIQALVDAHEAVIGGEPPGPLLEILVAHSALETAQWKAMWCNNWGNIRGSWRGLWTSFRAGEIEGGHEVILDPGPDNMFRAYPDIASGAEDFVSFLGIASHPPEPNRYQAAWDAACRGDVEGYCAGLRAGGYFTASPHAYLVALHSEETFLEKLPAMQAYLRPIIGSERSPTDPAPAPEPEGHPI